ncbi:MAG: PDDEXK nuclease domain-containing protein [bacterium]|nr:PDDEXK nuclease domain-containing protein [bacterium]
MISQQKIKEWVDIYLRHIAEITPRVHVDKEEGYKFKAVDIFQRNFDIKAQDLDEMLDASIVNNNLVAGSWYFPRKMLLLFAENSPEETRKILLDLFDETRPVDERIDAAEAAFNQLMDARNKRFNAEAHSFIGIRFLSLLLSYRYPEAHNALKPREWKVYCRFVDFDFRSPQGITSGKQYELFIPYVEALRQYIMTLPEIRDLKILLTDGLAFQDDDFRWMTQDVIYVTSQVLARLESDKASLVEEEEKQVEGEDVEDEEKIPSTTSDRFYYEEDLENFIIDNFDKLEFGQDLKLFADEIGATGRQYHTDWGDIDILALGKSGDFVVIELKRDRAKADVIGQIAKYIQWVDDNLAQKNGKKVSGIIIAYRGDPALVNAARALRFPVSIKYYRLGLRFTDS